MSSIGQIHRISVSRKKGTKKNNVDRVELRSDHGIIGDAHAGSSRQVSLLPFESFAKITDKLQDVRPGDFAENITTVGFDYSSVAVGTRISIGDTIELVVTQIGKECHRGCHIREIVGDCIMPREGVFAAVARGGTMKVGDRVRRLPA